MFIAGQQAPPSKQMGHAAAIISSSATVAEKNAAFEGAGILVAKEPSEIPFLLRAQK